MQLGRTHERAWNFAQMSLERLVDVSAHGKDKKVNQCSCCAQGCCLEMWTSTMRCRWKGFWKIVESTWNLLKGSENIHASCWDCYRLLWALGASVQAVFRMGTRTPYLVTTTSRKWTLARWQFRSPLETGCTTSEVPDSSFEAHRNSSSWGLGTSHGKAAGKVLNVVRLSRGAGKGQMAVSKPNRKLWRLGRAR